MSPPFQPPDDPLTAAVRELVGAARDRALDPNSRDQLNDAADALRWVGIAIALVIVAFLAFSGRAPSPAHVGLFGLLLVHYFLLVVGFGLASSVLFLRYRDLNQVWDLAIQAGFFVAPIIYPLDILPERYHWYLYLWPPTLFIQLARLALVKGEAPTLRAYGLLFAATALALAVGVLVYRRHAPRAAENL